MRYALMREMDISNGEGVGVSLFTQGCRFHCKGCFNKETWDYDGGKEWNEDSKKKFFKLIDRPFISRVSILGGEPLSKENFPEMTELLREIKEKFPTKKIWLYTGFDIMSALFYPSPINQNDKESMEYAKNMNEAVLLCDVIIDGTYIEELKDITLKWRGSSNQRIWVKKDNAWLDMTKEMG